MFLGAQNELFSIWTVVLSCGMAWGVLDTERVFLGAQNDLFSMDSVVFLWRRMKIKRELTDS